MGDKVDGSKFVAHGEDLYAFERATIAQRRPGRSTGKTAPDAALNIASDFTGLALSGGGVRSAAVCLGAIQALHVERRLGGFDYLSTVSGGGYIGACLSIALAAGNRSYPFGEGFSDSAAVSYLRDYSNYLLPRSRSLARNLADGAVIILRGLVANAICVLAFLLPAALLSAWLFMRLPDKRGVLASLADRLATAGATPALPTYVAVYAAIVLAAGLALWAATRAFPGFDRATGDTDSGWLHFHRRLLLLAVLIAFVEVQPWAIAKVQSAAAGKWFDVTAVTSALSVSGIATFASSLGGFLKRSEHESGLRTAARRVLAKLLLYAGAAILPLLLWLTYLLLTGELMQPSPPWRPVLAAYALCFVLVWFIRPNGYSLHGFYRDRLAKAFLGGPIDQSGPQARKPKLSELKNSSGPYPLINAALNIQGSPEANQRGREADFFVFTPDYVGSNLTGYAPTIKPDGYEAIDPRIDLASAVAISGASVSANMGSHTVRALSPTLSLLNVRLGYWIKNPKRVPWPSGVLARVKRWFWDRAFLLTESLNRADQHRDHLYLSDGGHIENLGIYQLLQRKCGLIFAIDAEADEHWSCGSLLTLERYARIDLGARIDLPWEKIAARSVATSGEIRGGKFPTCCRGPHCAIGTIDYGNGSRGVLVYVKSSLSGDEKDYLIDYARRHPTFPHEATSDQFFSEEQFEMYRALGFHMVNRFFHGDEVGEIPEPPAGLDSAALRSVVDALLPKAPG